MAQKKDIILRHPKDPSALLDIIRDVQDHFGHVPEEAVARVAAHLKLSEAEVRGAVTFYHFFSLTPRGASTVYLNDSITSRMKGRTAVAKAFEEEAGCRFGEGTADGLIGLFSTSCIGRSDQEPSAIINGVVFTRLTPLKVKHLVKAIKTGKPAREMVTAWGDGANKSDRVRSMVSKKIRKKGPVIFGPFESGSAIKNAVARKPEDI